MQLIRSVSPLSSYPDQPARGSIVTALLSHRSVRWDKRCSIAAADDAVNIPCQDSPLTHRQRDRHAGHSLAPRNPAMHPIVNHSTLDADTVDHQVKVACGVVLQTSPHGPTKQVLHLHPRQDTILAGLDCPTSCSTLSSTFMSHLTSPALVTTLPQNLDSNPLGGCIRKRVTHMRRVLRYPAGVSYRAHVPPGVHGIFIAGRRYN